MKLSVVRVFLKAIMAGAVRCGAVFIIVLLIGCEPESDLIRRFTIYKGEHYSQPRLVESLQSNELMFDARFDETAMYDLGESQYQHSKNKLMGFSGCNQLHHENSARFTWQWVDNQLEIYAYCYVDNDRVEQYIGTVELYEINRYSIKLTDEEYIFTLANYPQVRVKRGTSECTKGIRYMLWPFFGGQLPAPHDVHIDIRMHY
jgi:hypothetical protein